MVGGAGDGDAVRMMMLMAIWDRMGARVGDW